MDAQEYQAKHETQLIHDYAPSYDPAVYGGTYPDRFHIKTVQVLGLHRPAHCFHWLTNCTVGMMAICSMGCPGTVLGTSNSMEMMGHG